MLNANVSVHTYIELKEITRRHTCNRFTSTTLSWTTRGGIYFSSLMVSLLLMTQSLFTTAVTVILDLLNTVQAWRLHYWVKAEQDTTWYHAAYFLRHCGAHLGLNWPGYNHSNGDRSRTGHTVDSHTVNFIGDRSVDCVLWQRGDTILGAALHIYDHNVIHHSLL